MTDPHIACKDVCDIVTPQQPLAAGNFKWLLLQFFFILMEHMVTLHDRPQDLAGRSDNGLMFKRKRVCENENRKK